MTFANEHRFAGKPDLPPARKVRTSRFTPNTEAEYRDLVVTFHKLNKWTAALHAMKKARDETPERYRDEYAVIPGVMPLELEEAIKKATELHDEIDAGLDEWEG